MIYQQSLILRLRWLAPRYQHFMKQAQVDIGQRSMRPQMQRLRFKVIQRVVDKPASARFLEIVGFQFQRLLLQSRWAPHLGQVSIV